MTGPDEDRYGDITVGPEHRNVCRLRQDDAPEHDYNAEQWANARLIAAAPFGHEILDEISQALEQANGRETSQITRNELAPSLARIRQYFKQVKGCA